MLTTLKQTPPTSAAAKSPAIRGSSTGFRSAWLLIGIIAVALAGGTVWLFARDRGPTIHGYRVVNAYPHDATAYTQGLVIDNGNLYEGTGREGTSTLRRVDLTSGKVLQQHAIDGRQFGEGITVMGDRVYQLTWKARTCYVYDRETFRELNRFRYDGQGWGLTHDGKHLIMSDGSSGLRFIDPDTFKVVRTVWVRSGGRAITNLNELEYINGEIFANIWYKDVIARIDPETGNVNSWIDLTNLYPLRKRRDRECVLNGIAWDAENKRLFVTGKYWPKLYEIEVTGR